MSESIPSADAQPTRSTFPGHIVIVAVSSVLMLACLLAAGMWLVGEGDVVTTPLGVKLIEIVAQTIAVTIAGGLLVQAYLKWHSRELAIQEFRRAILDGLIKEYMDTKKRRRLLRAHATKDGPATPDNPWTHVPISCYVETMEKLNDTQLALETLCCRVAVFSNEVPGATRIEAQARLMERYLGNVVKEYERHQVAENKFEKGVPLSEFPELKDFMSKKDELTFGKFSTPYHAIITALSHGAVRAAV